MYIATLASSWQGSLCHYHIWITHNHWPLNIRGIHIHNCHCLYPTLRQHTVSSTRSLYHSPQGKVGGGVPTNRFPLGRRVLVCMQSLLPACSQCTSCMCSCTRTIVYNACTYVGASICTPVVLSEPNKGFHRSCINISYNATAKKLAWLLDLHNGLSLHNYNSIQSHKHSSSKYQVNETPTACTVWCWLPLPLIWSRGVLTTFSTRMWYCMDWDDRHQ